MKKRQKTRSRYTINSFLAKAGAIEVINDKNTVTALMTNNSWIRVHLPGREGKKTNFILQSINNPGDGKVSSSRTFCDADALTKFLTHPNYEFNLEESKYDITGALIEAGALVVHSTTDDILIAALPKVGPVRVYVRPEYILQVLSTDTTKVLRAHKSRKISSIIEEISKLA